VRCTSANDEPRFRHARWPDRSSISNFTYNHIGHFAASNHAFAKGVYLGGLLRRYPSLNFGFMEGGVSWACQLCADLIEHWEKRRPAGLQNPTATSIAEMHRLIAQYGDARVESQCRRDHEQRGLFAAGVCRRRFRGGGNPVERRYQGGILQQLLLRLRGRRQNDPMGLRSADGFRLRPVFSSDFTHFDVPDFREVIPEAFEMVEKGFVIEQDFREFSFTNAAMLHTRNNPGFSRVQWSSKRLPMSWAWKEHRPLRPRRQIIMTN